MLLEVIIIVLAGILAYAWVVYPVSLAMLCRGLRPEGIPDVDDAAACPSVAILLSAHNEEACIGDRVENLLALDYPRDRLTIHVGSDGSADRTAEIVRDLASRDDRIAVHQFIENRGKVAVLKDLVEEAADDRGRTTEDRGQILVLTDANTVFHKDALKKLVRHFADPGVGAVCGKLVLRNEAQARVSTASTLNDLNDLNDQRLNVQLPTSDTHIPTHPPSHSPSPEGLYWRWENSLKEWESARDSCLGVNGAIYGIRPGFFWREIPDNTLVDDFVLGLKVREQGARVLYDPEAVAEEELPEVSDEWVRRVRIGAGDYQALGLCRRCLLPSFGRFAWMFWSHKVLRWFTPHVLVALAACAVVGAVCGSRLGMAVVFGMTIFGLCAGAGRVIGESVFPSAGVLKACLHFLVMQAALFAGSIRYCRGGLTGAWRRTPRKQV